MIGTVAIGLIALSSPEWLFTAAARTHPAGGYLGGEALFQLDERYYLGPYAQYSFYWAELGAKLEARFGGRFVTGGLWLGIEPGFYVRATSPDPDERSAGLRGVARARIEVNLRGESLWLYSRSTAEGRLRSFAERDPYRDAVFDQELSAEQALAFLVAPLPNFWLYLEGTVAAAVDVGLLDLRPSAGIVLEASPSWTFDLDFYYSLREGPLEGFGVLLFVWWRP